VGGERRWRERRREHGLRRRLRRRRRALGGLHHRKRAQLAEIDETRGVVFGGGKSSRPERDGEGREGEGGGRRLGRSDAPLLRYSDVSAGGG